MNAEKDTARTDARTAGETANGSGARCVAWVNAANAGLALGGAALVALMASDGLMHALTLGALLTAAAGCFALAMIAGRRCA